MNDVEKLKIQKAAAIMKNPVLWAKAFLRTVNNATKKIEPWTARWYQAEMLLDPSLKKVARCGRRTGGSPALLHQIAGIPYKNLIWGIRSESFCARKKNVQRRDVKLFYRKEKENLD